MKSARPLLVVALLAVLAACSQSKTEPAITPVAALPEAPPPMMAPIAPPAEPYIASSRSRHPHKVVKRTVRERKVVRRTHAKTVKVVTVHHHHHHHHHAKTAHNAAHPKHAATKLASRAKPMPASVPLDSPAPATRPSATAAGPLTPGLR